MDGRETHFAVHTPRAFVDISMLNRLKESTKRSNEKKKVKPKGNSTEKSKAKNTGNSKVKKHKRSADADDSDTTDNQKQTKSD